jgi:hypothetical protein
MGVTIEFRNPPRGDLSQMARLIDQAIASVGDEEVAVVIELADIGDTEEAVCIKRIGT